MITRACWRCLLISLAFGNLVLNATPANAHSSSTSVETLRKLGQAPAFSLVAQDGSTFTLADVRGKVVVLSFIFTRCTDTCPLVVYKLVGLQEQLGQKFGRDVYFVSVSVDPGHDRPAVLAQYAEAHGCDLDGWSFLTGTANDISTVAGNYGVYQRQADDGKVAHNLLTSVIDQHGQMRVQYMGERFDPAELLHDVRDLVAEAANR